MNGFWSRIRLKLELWWIRHRAYPYDTLIQGHWHVEYVRVIARRPGMIVLGIGTEEKRPHLANARFAGREQEFIVASREGSCHFRDGEDGSEPTVVTIRFPWCLPWRTWVASCDDWDRYESKIIAYTRNRYRWEEQ